MEWREDGRERWRKPEGPESGRERVMKKRKSVGKEMAEHKPTDRVRGKRGKEWSGRERR